MEASEGFTIVFGPSEPGKTTLLNCIAGISRQILAASPSAHRLFDAEKRSVFPSLSGESAVSSRTSRFFLT